jgi:hypothetical protein
MRPLPLMTTVAMFLALVATPRTASAQEYVYSGAPFAVQSGTSCRAKDVNARNTLQMNEGSIRNISSVNNTVDVFCPFERRNLAAYAQPNPGDLLKFKLGVALVQVNDGTALDAFGCSVYALDPNTGSSTFSPTHWACAVTGGCKTKPALTFTGNNLLIWWPQQGETWPLSTTTITSVNTGLKCGLPKSSDILWTQTSFNL